MWLRNGIKLLALGLVIAALASAQTKSPTRSDLVRLKDVLKGALSQEALDKIPADAQVLDLDGWGDGVSYFKATLSNGAVLQVRSEANFVVLWYHSDKDLYDPKAEAGEAIRLASSLLLKDSVVLAPDKKLAIRNMYGRGPAADAEMTALAWPKELTGTKALSCSYMPIKRQWSGFAEVQVLLQGKDMAISLARQATGYGQKFPMAGPDALSDKLAEPAILPKADIDYAPDPLINACLWPTAKNLEKAKAVTTVGELLDRPASAPTSVSGPTSR